VNPPDSWGKGGLPNVLPQMEMENGGMEARLMCDSAASPKGGGTLGFISPHVLGLMSPELVLLARLFYLSLL